MFAAMVLHKHNKHNNNGNHSNHHASNNNSATNTSNNLNNSNHVNNNVNNVNRTFSTRAVSVANKDPLVPVSPIFREKNDPFSFGSPLGKRLSAAIHLGTVWRKSVSSV